MLEIKNIDLFYGASQAIKNVSFSAVSGEVTCILGRNGVGKTSLMKSIAGQELPRSGSIIWQANEITKLQSFKRAQLGIAYVPQGREIFPLLTVEENLKTGFAVQSRKIQRISEEIFELFPILFEMMSRRGGDLSGGQQQQLAIGRALVMEPSLLILDEPTEGIQPSIIQDIGRAIDYLRQKKNITILLVEQYFEFARDLADSYIVMDRGQVVMNGRGMNMIEEDVRQYLTI